MLLPGKTLPNSNRPSRSVGVPRKTMIRDGFPWGPEVIRTNPPKGALIDSQYAYSVTSKTEYSSEVVW